MTIDACNECLRRTDLIAAVAGSIEIAWREKRGRAGVLALPDEKLLALDPSATARYATFDPESARTRLECARLQALCRCADAYPTRLHELPDPPAVLHIAGHLAALAPTETVAIVGARRASAYGLEVSRALGRGLTAAGVPVVSGMALGIDSAAHVGSFEAVRAAAIPLAAQHGAFAAAPPPAPAPAAAPLAVLAGAAEVPYPARLRPLHARLTVDGAVVSEMPAGFRAMRWCFPARNRLIAALGTVTVVVEAAPRSGSLITADLATDLGRTVAAVPGPVTSRFSEGTNDLLHQGAALVRGPRDVLDLLFGADAPPIPEPDPTAGLDPPLRRLLAAVEQGNGTIAEIAHTVEEAEAALRGLSRLELAGLVRRGFGGRYVRSP